MKTTIKHLLAFVSLFVIATFGLSGCSSTLDKVSSLVTKPVPRITTVTNSVIETRIEVVTNFVPVIQNINGVATTNIEAKVESHATEIPMLRIESVTNVTYVLKDGLSKGVNVATAGAAFIPPPYGTATTAALGILSGALAFLVRRKNGQNESLTGQLTAVVHGVEQATLAIDPKIGETIKNTIATTSKILGVSDDLNSTVQTLTS
jgi:hypothetical protein